MSDQTKVLVTGASGFIAAHVVQQLLAEGYDVRGTVRSLDNDKKIGFLKEMPGAESRLELVEADLLSEDKWAEAVKGCQFVLHVASPFPSAEPRDPDEVIKPAVDGTLNVLKACAKEPGVKRVVLTSSIAAIGNPGNEKPYTEEDWLDIETEKMTYPKSKAMAEKAGWDFVKELKDDEKFELAVVNPGFVVGPMLSANTCTSLEVVQRMLEHKDPATIKLCFGMVDVRNVAAAEIAAMTLPEAAGHRHLLASGTMWMQDMARALQAEFKSQGYRIASMNAPSPVVWLMSQFDKSIKMVSPMVGKEIKMSNQRMREVLKINPIIEPKQSLIDMAYSMIELGIVKKSKKYLGHPGSRQTSSASHDELKSEAEKGEGEKKPEAEELKPVTEAADDAKAAPVEDEDDLKKPVAAAAEGDAQVIAAE